jgi:hypothetical protein
LDKLLALVGRQYLTFKIVDDEITELVGDVLLRHAIDKVFEIQSTDDDVLQVRTPELKVPYKEMNFIRLTFESPNTKCIYRPSVIIRNKANKKIEEILRFKIEVNDF